MNVSYVCNLFYIVVYSRPQGYVNDTYQVLDICVSMGMYSDIHTEIWSCIICIVCSLYCSCYCWWRHCLYHHVTCIVLCAAHSARFETGDRVTYTGKDYLCSSCLETASSVTATPLLGAGDAPLTSSTASPVASSTPTRPGDVTHRANGNGALSNNLADMSNIVTDSKYMCTLDKHCQNIVQTYTKKKKLQFLAFSHDSTENLIWISMRKWAHHLKVDKSVISTSGVKYD